MAQDVSSRRALLGLIVLATLLSATLGTAGPTAETATVVPTPLPRNAYSAQGHIDTPTSDLYVAETLTTARWSVGATKERFIGRPFWMEPLTGAGTRVAVIDTGFDPDHPDLNGRIVAWRDFLFGRSDPYDDDTHGTHVAGIIGAHGHFQYRPDQHYFPFGARGVAPGAEFIVAKAMDTNGDGDARHVADAVRWALDPNGDGDYSDGAHVINLSIGLEAPPEREDQRPIGGPITIPGFRTESAPEAQVVRDAILHAVRAGAIVVVAAGNHEPGAAAHTVTFPGTMKEVITVGALDSEGRVAAFSNTGAPGSMKPDLVAPGVLLSTFPLERDLNDSNRDGYVALGGTSMAAPVVSGTVALMLEGDPTLRQLSATEDLSWHTTVVRNALVNGAKGDGHDPSLGYGILQVDATVDSVDRGDGALNWSNLLLIALLVALIVSVVLLRRRRQRNALAIHRAKAAARARLQRDDTAERLPITIVAPDPAEEELPIDPPAWQRAPWERDESERTGDA